MHKYLVASVLASVVCFAQDILSNDAVIRLVKTGISDEIIARMVNDQPGRYSLTANDVIVLKQSGVSDKILFAMISHASPTGTPVLVSPIKPLVLHDGTPLRLRLKRNLSSADAKAGDTVDFEVLDEVKVDDVLVIARDTTAIGSVTQAQAKRRMGRGGKLDIAIEYVRLVNGEKAALRGVKDTSGGGHTGAMTGAIVATAIVVWPAAPFFLFMHGKDSTMPKGTEITAYINGEIRVNSGVSAQVEQPAVPASLIPTVRAAEPSTATAARREIATPVIAARKPNAEVSSIKPTETSAVATANRITARFKSTPANAEVSIDGIYWGTTPMPEVTRLEAGTHTIVVKKLGYKVWERKVDLGLGDDLTVNAALEVDVAKPHIAGLN